MKKLFTFFAAAALAMSAFATDYAGKISVSINGIGSTQDASISINQNEEDSTYTLNIKNFTLVTEETTINVGNIVVENLKGYTIGGMTTVVADQTINIQNGDDPNVEMWFGPYLGDVPIIMAAQFDGNDAKVDIDIDMTATLEQFISVKFETPGINGVFGDVDGDGVVTAGDITTIYNILLGN